MQSSPLKFLDAYQPEDTDSFFGREQETAQLYNALHRSNLTILYGASGTGKTSIVQCGLAQRFYTYNWLPITIRRKDNINQSLVDALNRKIPVTSDYQAPNSIGEQLQMIYDYYFKTSYLIFDQFEELFIHGEPDEKKIFFKAIRDLLSNRGVQAKIILVIREDWYAALDEFESWIPYLYQNKLRIEKMTDLTLKKVIGQICEQANIKIETPAINAIVKNIKTRQDRVDLPHLQVYLYQLHQKYLEKNTSSKGVTFDLKLIELLGSKERSLSNFLKEQLPKIVKELAKKGLKIHPQLPLEILFALSSNNQTKQAISLTNLIEHIDTDTLPSQNAAAEIELKACLEALKAIRLVTSVQL